eukprot:19187-Pelagococcus_subviridis.AAC.2
MCRLVDVRDVREEPPGDGDERLVRPRLEPVDDGAVDERGEVSRAHAEFVADGGEAQAHVQVLANLVDEKVPQVFIRVHDPRGFHLVPYRVAHVLLVLRGHEVGNEPAREEVVDVHQEALVHDLRIRHQKRNRRPLDARLRVQPEEIRLEVDDAVRRRHGDLEHVVLADERRELRERLLPAAADADEHRVPSREVQDARDSRHVVHGLVEEHEVHHRVGLVVLRELFHERLVQLFVRRARAVRALVVVVKLLKRVVGHRARLDLFHLEVAEVLLRHEDAHLVKLGDVRLRHHAVGEYALALVDPQARHGHGVGVKLRNRAADALADVRQLAQVPLVVKLHRGGQKRVRDERVNLDRRVRERRRLFLDVVVKLHQVAVDDLRKHRSHRVLRRHLHREGHEVTLHARRDVERPRGGVHRRHVLAVEHLLEDDLVLVVPAAVVDVLTRELDGRLRVVLVHEGHVDVVEKVHEATRAGRAEAHAGLLLERLLQDDLQRGRVHEVVHVHRGEGPRLGVEVLQVFAHERGFSRARVSDEHAVVLVLDEAVQEIRQARAVHARHEDVRERLGRVVAVALNLIRPRRHLRFVVNVVIEHQAALGVQHLLPLADPPLVELQAEVHHLVHEHRAAEGPHAREDELRLEELLVRLLPADVLRRDDSLENLAHRARDVHRHERHDRPEVSPAVLQRLLQVAIEQLDEKRAVVHRLARLDPRLHHRLPADVVLVQVNHAAARHRRGGAVHHVVDLEQKSHRVRQRDALVRREREHLVVVHHRVHGLDPLRVDVAVEDDPLIDVHLVVRHVAERHGHQPLLPFARGRVEESVELVAVHRLGVHRHRARFLAEHGPPHAENLAELRDLQHESLLGLVPELHRGLHNLILERLVPLTRDLVEHLGEEIVKETHEDAVVVRGELPEVEIAKRLQKHLVLGEVRLVALETAGDLPVVVRRLGEQVLAELVENHKLARENLGLQEPLAHEHVFANQLQIRDAHGHRSEQRLERLRELRATGVAGVHRDERHRGRAQRNLHVFKHELRLLRANRVEDRLVLRRAHGQHRHRDAVELVEAAPRASLRQALVRLPHRLVIHLIGAVEDVHLNAERATEILHRLRLARPRGARGGAAEDEPLRLRQRDVAPIRERGDD